MPAFGISLNITFAHFSPVNNHVNNLINRIQNNGSNDFRTLVNAGINIRIGNNQALCLYGTKTELIQGLNALNPNCTIIGDYRHKLGLMRRTQIVNGITRELLIIRVKPILDQNPTGLREDVPDFDVEDGELIDFPEDMLNPETLAVSFLIDCIQTLD